MFCNGWNCPMSMYWWSGVYFWVIFQCKDCLSRYRDSHYKGNIVMRIPIRMTQHLYIETCPLSGNLQPFSSSLSTIECVSSRLAANFSYSCCCFPGKECVSSGLDANFTSHACCFPGWEKWLHYQCRLLHSPRLVAEGLSVGYEIWPPIDWNHTHLCLVALYIGWNCLSLQWIVDSCDQWEFPLHYRGHWQFPSTALRAGNLPVIRTVHGDCERVYFRSHCSVLFFLPHFGLASLRKLSLRDLGDISISDQTSYCQIAGTHECNRSVFRIC